MAAQKITHPSVAERAARGAEARTRTPVSSHKKWQPVARSTGEFDRALRPGSYRVAVLGGPAYTASVTAPVALRPLA